MPRASRSSLPRKQRPPKSVTRDLFLIWRAPRIGLRNPHNFTNPVWTWLASQPELSAYQANRHFRGPSSLGLGPCWCAARFGQTRTTLDDGRIVLIGGEHEDYYDPDFYIYNDVIVQMPSGERSIYGYPNDIFPPTDGHTATLAGDRIVVIGSIGYVWDRDPERTPLCSLDTGHFAITPLHAEGEGPGWISAHEARLIDDGRAIELSGGNRCIERGDTQRFVENLDVWRLDLERLHWTRCTRRPSQQWAITRADHRSNSLFDLSSMHHYVGREDDFSRGQLERFVTMHGCDPDLAAYEALYRPSIDHEVVDDDDSYPRVILLRVQGVIVRCVEDSGSVRVVIEGELPQAIVAALVEELRSKVEAIERVAVAVERWD